jgi:hypothetical protein
MKVEEEEEKQEQGGWACTYCTYAPLSASHSTTKRHHYTLLRSTHSTSQRWVGTYLLEHPHIPQHTASHSIETASLNATRHPKAPPRHFMPRHNTTITPKKHQKNTILPRLANVHGAEVCAVCFKDSLVGQWPCTACPSLTEHHRAPQRI